MAFTTPATATAGTVLTAAFLNTNVRDNVAWLATDSPCCRVYNSAVFALTNGVTKSVTFDSERFDNATMHDTSSNTARITVPTGGGGKYMFGFNYLLASAPTTNDSFVNLNGVDGAGTIVGYESNGTLSRNAVSSNYALAAADFIVFNVNETALSVNISVSANYSPEAYCYWFRT